MKSVEDVRSQLVRREWDNHRNLRDRLIGARPFPIKVSINPPSGDAASADPANFHRLQQEWREFKQGTVFWRQVQFRAIGSQDVPTAVTFNRMSDLLSFLGGRYQAEAARWASIISIAEQWDAKARRPLLERAPLPFGWTEELVAKAVLVAEQLKPNFGKGYYPRGLPISGVDTKFVESNRQLLELLCVARWGEDVSEPGLYSWLGLEEKPELNLILRIPPDIYPGFGGLKMLKLDWRALNLLTRLNPDSVLIVENAETTYVPVLHGNMVVVGGGGRNLQWIRDCGWMSQATRVAYWGDIDVHGFELLDEARAMDGRIESLLMESELVESHNESVVIDNTGHKFTPSTLNTSEASGLQRIMAVDPGPARLEQERICTHVVAAAIIDWANS